MDLHTNFNTDNLDREARDRALDELVRQLRGSENSQTSLPEHPVSLTELPDVLPQISFAEIRSFLSARNAFLMARADYERRRADLIYKLAMGCKPEDQGQNATFLISLDADGQTIRIIGGGLNEKLTDRR